jgi:hypothetical protein
MTIRPIFSNTGGGPIIFEKVYVVDVVDETSSLQSLFEISQGGNVSISGFGLVNVTLIASSVLTVNQCESLELKEAYIR